MAAKLIFGNIREAYEHPDNMGKKQYDAWCLLRRYSNYRKWNYGSTRAFLSAGRKVSHCTRRLKRNPVFHVMEFNMDACENRLAQICDVIHPAYAKKQQEKSAICDCADSDIVKVTNIPTDLAGYGVTVDDVEFLVAAGSRQQRLLVNNPKELSLEDIRTLYLKVIK